MNIRRLIIIIVFSTFLIVAVMAGALRSKQPSALKQTISNKETDSIIIVATTYPLYDFTRAVVGEAPGVTVKNLLPFNVGPHDFSPTTETTATISAASVIIKNGLGFDAYIEKLIAASGSRAVIINTSTGSEILYNNDAPDVHIWLNPKNAVVQIQHIRDALIAIDPENKNIYEQNTGRYMTLINRLDSEYEQTLEKVSQKKFVSYHGAFRYLAKRYGLEESATVVSAPEAEPSAREIALITKIIKDQKIKVIFSEPQFTPKIVESLATDLNLQILILDPVETGSAEDNYLAIMRRNLEALKKGLP